MTQISYTNSDLPIREDFAAVHNRYWDRLSKAGSWFSAEDKIAIASEARKARVCEFCRQRKEALSPMHAKGEHDSDNKLSEIIIDVVHRIVTDPGRLTKSWFDEVMKAGVTEEQYVEILGTIVAVFNIDEFCRALGLDLNPLPEPLPGEPDRYRPETAINGEAWVSMIPMNGNTGNEADLWSGRTGNVNRALSLVPDEVRTVNELMSAHYVQFKNFMDFTGSPRGTLSRLQMEVFAARVSALNGCFY
jgi:hypothetical protein